MNTFGSRLREQRTSLKLSQAAFAKIGGVQKLAQIKYEKGERTPGAEYLTRIAAAGIDVPYVLTGERTRDDVLHNMRIAAQITGSAVMTGSERGALNEKYVDMARAATAAHRLAVAESPATYAAAPRLRSDQVELLDAYERCGDDTRRAVLQLLTSGRPQCGPISRTKRKPKEK